MYFDCRLLNNFAQTVPGKHKGTTLDSGHIVYTSNMAVVTLANNMTSLSSHILANPRCRGAKQSQTVCRTGEKLERTDLTSLDKGQTFLLRHVRSEVGINITIDVTATGATNGTGLPHAHPTKGNAVHLIDKPASSLAPLLHRTLISAWRQQSERVEFNAQPDTI